MIITKTPLRISFAGGGTDLAAFYERQAGAVVSMAVDLYVYLAVHRFFEDKFVLKYSRTEEKDRVEDIEHPLIRECLMNCRIDEPIEITSFADIPSKGSGLGGSSAFAVGLVKALHAFAGKNASAETCAQMACEVEIDRLGEPIGKQDQYAAAFGGLNFIEFKQDGSVAVEPIILTRERRSFLEERLVMFYTGQTRSASKILSEQKANTGRDTDKFAALVKMRAMADELRDLLSAGDVEQMGDFLHRGWLLKRQLASGVSSSAIDEMYEAGLAAGAEGGKVLGAGGGGFLLFYCAPENQGSLRKAMAGHREIRPHFDGQGTRVIYVDD